jgi:hypothetical protein
MIEHYLNNITKTLTHGYGRLNARRALEMAKEEI